MFCPLLYLSRFNLGYYVGVSNPSRTSYSSPFASNDSVQGRMSDCQGQIVRNVWVSSTSSVLFAAERLHPACCLEELLRRQWALASEHQSASQTVWLLSFSALAKQESVFMCRRKTLEHNRNFKVKTEEPLEWGTSWFKQMLNKGFQDHSSGFKHLNSF